MILLLICIYIIFISLGLPDSILGASWPVMYQSFGVDIGFAAVLSMVTLIATAFTSFLSGKYIRKFGTFKTTFFSVILTIVGMVGIASARSLWIALPFFIILGMGGGAIDTALNAYVSKHFSALQLNWLHAFWGVGVTASPLLLSLFLNRGAWRQGYLAIATLQSAILLFVFLTRRVWKLYPEDFSLPTHEKSLSRLQILRQKGMALSIISAILYAGLEFSLGTWGASYLVFSSHFTPDSAARLISLYFLGITVGRLIVGVLTKKLSDNALINLGAVLAFVGLLLFLVPSTPLTLVSLLLIGLGFAPVVPCIFHRIPSLFNEHYTADIMGFHMGFSYPLGFLLQGIIGYIATHTHYIILPLALLVLCALLLLCNLGTMRLMKHHGDHA